MQNEPRIPRRCSIFPGRAPHPPRPSRRWGAVAALVALAAVLGIATPEDARAQAPPGPPRNFTATAGDTQVVLKWVAPASAGGAAITSYQYRTAVGATVPESHSWISGTDLEATVPGLTNGTQYAFEVRAKNRNIGGEGPVATATATPVADVTLTWDAREAGLEPSFTVTITFLEAVDYFTLDDISVTAINISDLFEEPGAFHQWELPAENFQGSGTTYSVEVTLEPRTITDGPVGNRTPRILQPQKVRVIIPVNAAQAANGGTPKKRTAVDISLTLTVPPVTGTEREALEAFYHATDGPNWTDSTNWLDATKPLGEWHGVTTNTDGEVTRLILRGNELSGSLPAELGNLRNLTRLYLHQNALSGAIPPELGHLRNLGLLLLHQNALSGAIPPDLGLLENLTHLYLRQNTLSGAIPPKLGDLSKLQRLYLQGNDLSGAIPPELGLSSLVDLKLHSNADLSGPLPATFPTAMPTLKELGMQNTGVSIPETAAFTDWTARITSGTQTSDGVITLDAANTRPSGLWADETTLYVVGEVGGKVYAYTLADGVRDTAKDITLDAANIRPTGLWSDGTTLYVLNYHIDNGADDGKIYAYTLADGGRDTDKDIIGPVSAGYGLWGRKDATCTGRQARCLLWVARSGQSPINLNAYRIYADADATPPAIYGSANDNFGKTLPTGDLLDILSWVSGFWWKDPEPGGDSPPTVWISDFLDAGLYAYRSNPRAVEFSSDIVSAVEQDRILAPANLNPTAFWSDGTTWWVADFYAGKVFVYGPSAPPPVIMQDPLGVPQNFSATAGDTRVVLSWAAPASDGGTAITKYEYRYSAGSTVDTSATSATWADVPDGADADTDAGNETTFTVTGLSNGTQYAFEVRAVNSGDGPAATDTATPIIPTPITSTDATLSALALSDAADDSTIELSPPFAPSTTSYTASVPNGVEQITIAPTTTNTGASVAYFNGRDTVIADADATNGQQVSLDVGANTIEVKVTAEDTTTTLTYTVTVTRIPSSDATLSALALSNAADNLDIPLRPPFAPSITRYMASVPNGVEQITIAPTTTNNGARVAYLDGSDMPIPDADTKNGQQVSLAVGANTIEVKVTAEDTTTTLTYTVTVTRAPATGIGPGGRTGGGGGGSSQDDHGNTPAQATLVTLDPTRTASVPGQINTAADVDYFSVAVPHAGVLVVETSGPTATVGTVWQDGEELATAASGGVGRNFRLSVRVAPGSVVIAVAGNGQQTGTYTLQVTFLPGYLENPGAASFQSGIGVISGWVCDAEEVEIVLNGEPQEAAYGTARLDTESVCGDADNGFGLLFNWNLLGDGAHEVVALVDGVELDRATVTVTTLGAEFLREVTGRCTAADFPTMDETVTLAWQQTQQNFVIVDGMPPTGANRAGTPGVGYLENPGPNSFQSGIGVLSGWACEGTEVVIELNGQPQPAAYGTERLDTLEMCGDTANGFGLLFNWNLLGEGEHEVVAFVDGEELGRATVQVTTLGVEFVRDVEGECTVEDFPMLGETVTLEWQQNSQNFVVTDVE